jgi:hypothetical protein
VRCRHGNPPGTDDCDCHVADNFGAKAATARKKRTPVEVDPTSCPGAYYVVERFGKDGWQSVTGSYRTAAEAQWARAALHVATPALAISATRVTEWSWAP